MNLKAHNLVIFNHILEGIDDETWFYHLRRRDFSRWFKHSVKDNELAAIVESVECDHSASSRESRSRIRSAIEERYSAPV